MSTFHSPIWLSLLILLLPVLVWTSFRSLSGLSQPRRWIALAVRSTLVVLVILALAEPQSSRGSQRATTIFVLDRSQSIPAAQADNALEFISRAMAESNNPLDTTGLVVFGKDPRFELPLAHPSHFGKIRSVRSLVDASASDLAGAIRLATAALPSEGVGRIVLLTDGNENRGNALAELSVLQQNGIPLDVVPIDYRRDREVLVEKIALAERLKVGDRGRLRVVLHAFAPARGTLRIERLAGSTPTEMTREEITLKEGVNVRTLDVLVTEADLVRLRAEFIPADPSDDFFPDNNSAETYAILEGPGRVLVIENQPGDQATLTDALRKEGLAVVAMQPEEVIADLAFLRAFDAVLVADVPAARLDEDHQTRIAASAADFGVGVLMVGGPQSFGPGGYEGSALEKALPVDCKVQSSLIDAELGIVLVIDRSGSMHGQKLAMALQGAKAAVKLLDLRTSLGILQFDSEPRWVRKLLPIQDREKVYRRIDTIGISGGTNMGPALQMALEALRDSEAMTKHVIVLSDGVSAPSDWDEIIRSYRKSKVSLTSVALGPDCDLPLLRRLAVETRGRFHQALHPSAVPSIYLRETRIVSRPLIYERPAPWSVSLADATEPVQGLPTTLPSITGLVLTTPKPSANVAIVSPQPAEIPVNPVLVHWQYGVGRAVAVATDAGQRWTKDWTRSDFYARFWTQVVRWSLRAEESKELHVVLEERDGKVAVVVDALGQDGEFLNFLDLVGTVHKPDVSREELAFRQREPGKYIAEFDATLGGSYIVNLSAPSADGPRLRATSGIAIAAAPEQRDVRSNRDLLIAIAERTGGEVVNLDTPHSVDFFRRDRVGRVRLEDTWPILLLVSLVLLLLDVAVRRIAIAPADVVAITHMLWQRWANPIPAQATESLDRLRARKIEIATSSERRAQIEPNSLMTPEPITQPPASMPVKDPAVRQSASKEVAPIPADSDRMSRLLKAKRKVWEDRE